MCYPIKIFHHKHILLKPLHWKGDVHSKSDNQDFQYISHVTRSVILFPNCDFIFSAISFLEICNFSKLGAVRQRKVRPILLSNCFKTNLSLNNLHFLKTVMFFSQVHGGRNQRGWEGGENEALVFDGYRVSVWKDEKDLEIHDNNGYTTMWM